MKITLSTERMLKYEIVRFVVFGIPGAILLYAIFKLLVSIGLSEIVAYIISQVINSIFNYPMQKERTFRRNYRNKYVEELVLRLYIFSSFAQVTIGTPLSEYFLHVWQLPDIPTLLILSIPKTGINFAISKLIVFKL